MITRNYLLKASSPITTDLILVKRLGFVLNFKLVHHQSFINHTEKSEKPPPLPHRVLHISTVLGAYEQQPPRHPIVRTFMRAHVQTPGMADAATIYVTCYRYGARCFTTPPHYLSFCTTHTLRMLYSHIINCVRNMHNKAKMRLGHGNARRCILDIWMHAAHEGNDSVRVIGIGKEGQ
ncbi:unnamed protein product [Trichogramma brassicae]|uniref:Uncharacterized protein n=1 Tax=Trichogramma brassicae TaxID=86971 RepID=A0A6H5IF32_9HYME|nr:unnamed protein product [Trichogramma brassicae]